MINLEVKDLLEELKTVLKDTYIAFVRKTGDGLELKFPNGQSFTVAVWENKNYQKNT